MPVGTTRRMASRRPRVALTESLESRRLMSVVFDSEGFEPPRYQPGPLEDQDPIGPWQKDDPRAGLAQVETTTVASGAQAVRLTRPAAPDGDVRYGVVKPVVPDETLNLIQISWDMNVPENTQPDVDFGPFFGVEAYDGFGGTIKLIGSLGVDAHTGDVLYQDGATGVFTETNFHVQLGTWNHFVLQLDYTNDSYTVIVNGDDKGTTGFVDDPIQGFTDAPLAALAASQASKAVATGSAFYDNYRIDLLSKPNPQTVAPTVNQVYVSGTQWTQTFKNYLERKGLGDEQYGYAVPAGQQLAELPWINIDTVSFRFSQDVQIDANDLQIRGINVPNYQLDPASFRYDAATRTASFKLLTPDRFKNDRIMLDLDADSPSGVKNANGVFLDGDWQNPPAGQTSGGVDQYPSGDGTPGGDFRFRLDILPGDADRQFERVNSLDLGYVKARANRTADETPPAGFNPYNPYADVTADGRINALDLGAVKARQNTTLPATDLQAVFSSALIAKRLDTLAADLLEA